MFLHDLDPMGFHLVNVLLHTVVCVAFIKMCLEVVGTGKMTAFIAGLHFATHPIHTEAVCNYYNFEKFSESMFSIPLPLVGWI